MKLKINNSTDKESCRMLTASDFQRLQNAISTNLKKINNNTTDLENLVQKLGTSEDSDPLRDRYLRLQNDTKSLMQQLNNDIKKLSEVSGDKEEQRKKKNFVDNVSKQYLAILGRFQEAQRTGARKEKESLERARGVTYRSSDVNSSQMDDNMSPFTGQQQKQVLLPMEQEVDMAGLKERGDQLRQLETNIVQVNELFKDVHTMIHEHGEIIDTIEQHTYQTEDQVKSANVQLVQAVQSQSAARRKRVMLCVVLLVIVGIIALILGIYFGTK